MKKCPNCGRFWSNDLRACPTCSLDCDPDSVVLLEGEYAEDVCQDDNISEQAGGAEGWTANYSSVCRDTMATLWSGARRN